MQSFLAKPDFHEMAQGVVVGAFNLSPYEVETNLQWCLVDAETILIDVAEGVEDILSFDKLGFEKFISSLGAAYYKLGEALEDCLPFTEMEDFNSSVEIINQMSMILQSPKSINFEKNKMEVNGFNLLTDLLSAKNAMDEGTWGNAGYFLGEAARDVLGTK